VSERVSECVSALSERVSEDKMTYFVQSFSSTLSNVLAFCLLTSVPFGRCTMDSTGNLLQKKILNYKIM